MKDFVKFYYRMWSNIINVKVFVVVRKLFYIYFQATCEHDYKLH